MPRRWFQIHLSTAIVMMIVASGLLYLNIRPAVRRDNPKHYQDHETYHEVCTRGWPLPICGNDDWISFTAGESPRSLLANDHYEAPFTEWDADSGTNAMALALDAIVAIVSLLGSAFVCEYFTRRGPA